MSRRDGYLEAHGQAAPASHLAWQLCTLSKKLSANLRQSPA
jgi:hypothetical protein